MTQKVVIIITEQCLSLSEGGKKEIFRCPVSTSAYGIGNRLNSFCTPLGKHIIRAKIGKDLPIGAVLKGRRWTGDICDAESFASDPSRDWILTRIMWLSGCEPGFNRLGDVDTMKRYIYIHGSPDQIKLDKPNSRGCIRVSNKDAIRLFDLVSVGTPVEILEN